MGYRPNLWASARLRPPEELHAPDTDKVGNLIYTDSQGAPNLPTYPARGYPPDTMIHSALGSHIAPDLLPWLEDRGQKRKRFKRKMILGLLPLLYPRYYRGCATGDSGAMALVACIEGFVGGGEEGGSQT